MYKVLLKRSAEKDLDKINEPFLSKIANEIDLLSSIPRNEKGRKLISKKDEYRLKVLDYKILFYIRENNKEIVIARILHRQESYKRENL